TSATGSRWQRERPDAGPGRSTTAARASRRETHPWRLRTLQRLPNRHPDQSGRLDNHRPPRRLVPIPSRPRRHRQMTAAADPLRTVRADHIELKSILWLEKPLLQDAAFHLVSGPKGVGKGTWIAGTTAKMTSGAYGRPRNVLIVSSEDSAGIDLAPRLLAAGADMSRVHIVVDHFTLPADLDRLRNLAADITDIGMIVVDPLSNHIGSADTDKEGAVRYAIGGLNKLADELSCVVLGVRHISKSRQHGALASV